MSSITVFKGSASGKVVQHKATTILEPQGKQVLIEVTHSGICGTDEHYRKQDMVLGHEGVGIIRAVGPSVKTLKKGDRVGWGYCHGSCGSCRECDRGQQLYCDERQLYGSTNLDQGSFSTHAMWDDEFVFGIPDAISSEEAAPLMCAGAAVYSGLKSGNIGWNSRVGILGFGGLGHLALQFAAKMGCEVVVLSHSSSKEKDARSLGASEFHTLSSIDSDKFKPVDCLLLSGAQQPDWNKVVPLVRRGGSIMAMTVDMSELNVPYMLLVMNAIAIRGSLPTPPVLHREMLDFAAFHGIRPIVQSFPFTEEGINEALERLGKGEIRYRAVVARA
ncbi:hypothetical protein CcaverHIS002_0706090 [Cutaneotrichosporon cavernicola]|uniref:Enoyl reductase (ER) domain-containing protein n=1 Tax=Cutaneotrichosporon cavernicola TaxID=279322 RepID=A0AA48LAQ7_9TREE|nr:uncharacterized protein CcaverHIS019_0706130 [Cutaneotrichosporon cavernicola]BEI87263.1 hypothetical protein CcaverHIS002_0706090 [Cutaneotrichosporon cavernicola]BEI95032.1 hypothetical protein CcaverHIS019_0706130 [Cutaneotrichosporon cavernicola]BEJ02806.1 hypothetical protein CcaverHIS631_0706010 [Cutaneotrichosporon cavernicola]BEJ10559.1 hypothetical protein CcaverHIS641_0705940 [Cutaneotrichosporon cavernicola]